MKILANKNKIIKIGIIEDSKIHCEWLKAKLDIDSDLEIVSIDRTARAGIHSAKNNNTDLILLDFQLTDLTGLEVVKRLSAFNRVIKIFMITAHTDISIIERLIIEKSIHGLAIKGSQYFGDHLTSAIKKIAAGNVYLDPSLLSKLREPNKLNVIRRLTRREFEVFIQSSSGKPDDLIAQDLCVELSHIKNIKSKILKKIKNTYINSILNKLVENLNPVNLPDK